MTEGSVLQEPGMKPGQIVSVVGVKRHVPAKLSEADGQFASIGVDQYGGLRQAEWLFGQPEIRCDNEGWGQWESKALQAKYKDGYDTNRHFRYGNWAVHLNGGPQASEESWASVSIPVNELKVKDITSIAYDWYAQYNGSSHILDIGPNLVWSAYDPNDHAKRVDFNTYAVDNAVFMDDGLVNRPVEAGWYKFKMTSTDVTERVYWYGNNTGTHSTAPAEGVDGYWSQFVADKGFADWVVYRIQIVIGFWGATRSTGDVWIDAPKINGMPILWEPSKAEQIEIEKRNALMFGEPTLQSNNNSSANWCQGMVSPLDQKGSTGWLACLYGGIQTGDDWARVNIPVNEMHVPDLKTALWSYYMTGAETMGVGMVIWVHDPFDFDNRAEITQLANVAGLEKGAGWNAHELNPSTTQFFFYGENTTKTNLTAGTQYTWAQFVSDELFNTWTIYRITLEYGWEASGTFDDVWVADIKINGVQIPLKPDSSGSGRIARRYVDTATTLALTIAPKTPYRLLTMDIHCSGVLATGELFTATKDAGLGTSFDTVVFSDDLFIGSRTSLFVPFGEGYDFEAEDEIDFANANGGSDTIGLVVRYQTVFA